MVGPDIPPKVAEPGKSPTRTIHLSGNLDQTATAPAEPFDPRNPEATSNFGTRVSVKDATGDWNAAGSDAHPIVASGVLRFDRQGRLISDTSSTSGVQTPAALQTIVIDLGDGMEAGGSGLDGMTQFAATSALNQVRSDDAYPSACAIELPGLTAADFRCWYASWD